MNDKTLLILWILGYPITCATARFLYIKCRLMLGLDYSEKEYIATSKIELVVYVAIIIVLA